MKKLLMSVLAGCLLCGFVTISGCSKKDGDTKGTSSTKTTSESKTSEK